jgi:hypothetical protein
MHGQASEDRDYLGCSALTAHLTLLGSVLLLLRPTDLAGMEYVPEQPQE